jgi:hypothetical protein
MNPTHRVRAVLSLPKSKVAALLTLAKAVFNAFTSNSGLLPQPSPALATVQAQIQALDTAQQATTTRTKGTVATRNAKVDVLVTSLESWRMYVQTLCDASPEQAEQIIAAAGMSVDTPFGMSARLRRDLSSRSRGSSPGTRQGPAPAR